MEWNLWIFHSYSFIRLWTLPLDGINNNKAKLRDSLITISRFHLTAMPLRMKRWRAGHCYDARLPVPQFSVWDVYTIEICHLFCVLPLNFCFSCFIFGSLVLGTQRLRLFFHGLPYTDHHQYRTLSLLHFSFIFKLFGGKHNRKLQLFPQYFYGYTIFSLFSILDGQIILTLSLLYSNSWQIRLFYFIFFFLFCFSRSFLSLLFIVAFFLWILSLLTLLRQQRPMKKG